VGKAWENVRRTFCGGMAWRVRLWRRWPAAAARGNPGGS
jgi:hypothetical protein